MHWCNVQVLGSWISCATFFHGSFCVISPILSLSLTDTFPSCDALPLFKNVAQRRSHERLQHVGLKPKGWQKIPTVLTRVLSARWLPPQGVPAWAGQKGELAKLEKWPAAWHILWRRRKQRYEDKGSQCPVIPPKAPSFGMSQSWLVTWVRLTWTYRSL